MRLKLATLVLCTCFATAATAENADRNKPIEINADNAKQANSVRTLSGNVDIRQGTLHIQADKLTVQQDKQGNILQLQTNGRPVKFRQKMEGSSEFIEGQALNINYDNSSDTIIFIGDARIKRGMDSVSGNRIVYNMASENYEVTSSANGSTGRVTVILQPKSKP